MIRKSQLIDLSIWHWICKSKSLLQPCEHIILLHTVSRIALNSTPFISTSMNCTPPIWYIFGSFKINCISKWLMQQECLHLGFADNLLEISICGWTVFFVIYRYHLCHCASPICKHRFSIQNGSGAARRNVPEPGFNIVHLSRANPHHPILPFGLHIPVKFSN